MSEVYWGAALDDPLALEDHRKVDEVRTREIYLRGAGDPCGNFTACVQNIRVGTILLGFKPRV